MRGDRTAHGARSTRRGRWHRRGDESGSTLVEAAFVMPIFMLMIFGIFEFTGIIMTHTGTDAAVKAGARMAVVAGNSSMADREILNRMATEGAGIKQDHILQIIIWRALTGGDSPPNPCNAASQCNLYNNPQDAPLGAFIKAKLPLSKNLDPTSALSYGTGTADYWFGCSNSNTAADNAHKLDCNWKPDTRRILEQSPTNQTYCTNSPSASQCQPTDMVGIFIVVRHKNYTGFFGNGVTVTSKTVSRIEPQGYDK